MKRWLAVLVLAGCSINHRSGDFACEKQADCSSGRTCVEGFCVAPDIDAGVKLDAGQSVCPLGCTSCSVDAKTCTIDCALNGGACNLPVTCPAGYSCNIACSTANSCRSGINCSGAKSCTITCAGRQSCENFSCGPGACNIDCGGRDSCRNISCGASCACDLTCHLGTSLCTGITCKSATCTLSNRLGCTSQGVGCNSCPK